MKAEEAFLALGDRLSRALQTGNAALYRSIMTLPLRIVPQHGAAFVIHGTEDLDADFATYRNAIVAAGVTDIRREMIGVTQVPEGHRVRYTVTLLVGDTPRGAPHETEMLLVPTPTGLKIAELASTSTLIDWTRHRGASGQAPQTH
ncbi:hypothetical protein [Xinfangfangia pollutisoli]|uniref:hypothetical protein n=1 Tax=Xinfangfangia pollutisoli TaxID=2865960 RepID=UPI001CD44446|nr:hypothetical protein [Xinfangfangia pollutisoli]